MFHLSLSLLGNQGSTPREWQGPQRLRGQFLQGWPDLPLPDGVWPTLPAASQTQWTTQRCGHCQLWICWSVSDFIIDSRCIHYSVELAGLVFCLFVCLFVSLLVCLCACCLCLCMCVRLGVCIILDCSSVYHLPGRLWAWPEAISTLWTTQWWTPTPLPRYYTCSILLSTHLYVCVLVCGIIHSQYLLSFSFGLC